MSRKKEFNIIQEIKVIDRGALPTDAPWPKFLTKKMSYSVLCEHDAEESQFSFETLEGAKSFMQHMTKKYPEMVLTLKGNS